MEDRRLQILYSAMKFFSEKGYYSTSVQEIAKDCGISKGSLYKYFQSKEELFIEVFEFFQNKMFEKARNIQFEHDLTNKEKFEKQILVEMEDFLEMKDIIMMQFKELPVHTNEQFMGLLHRTRVRMMNWRKRELMNAYGSKIENHIWDIAVIFQGILKEYLMLITKEGKYIDFKKLASSIVKRMDAVVNSYSPGEEPILSNSLMDEFEENNVNPVGSKKEKLGTIYAQVQSYLEKLQSNEVYKSELEETLSLLKEELGKQEPKLFLIHALLAYLNKENELKRYVKEIEILIEK